MVLVPLQKRPPGSNLDHFANEKTAIYKPRRVFSVDTKSAGTLTLDFQPPEPREINFHCF